MFGTNPKRKPSLGDGCALFIQEIFHTIQGEGIFAGHPAIFIRLGGCNLACKFCDTEFENFTEMKLGEVFIKTDKIKNEYPAIKLVVITGGEPMRQTLSPLIIGLQERGYKIQIETNGTLFQQLPQGVDIVCSPKVALGKYLKPHENLTWNVSALKFIISDSMKDYSELPSWLFSEPAWKNARIFLQPMDEYDNAKNLKNNELCVRLAIKYGFSVSIQMHKFLNIP